MTEAATILEDTVVRILSDHLGKAGRPDDGAWPAGLWQAVEEAGLPALMVPEDQGGAGAAPLEVFAVMRALGRLAAPIPLAETTLAAKLLAEAGMAVPAGPLTVVPATETLIPPGDGKDVAAVGPLVKVPWARHATAMVAVMRQEGGATLCCLELPQDRVTSGAGVGGEPSDRVDLPLSALSEAPSAPLNDGARLLRQGAAIRAAQMAGALEGALELTADYARERVQFGRPIARFQAIQQQLAELGGEVAAALTAARAAVAVMDDPHAMFEIAAAKCRVNEAATRGAAIAHQVHGAIGFTQEYALHHLTRRLWSWREDFGNETYWSELLGRLVAAGEADALWPRLTAGAGLD